MPKISILPESLINRIAAGEVIERPASVVRELIDNSLDAGAQEISVEVLYGGKKMIKVADNGNGMDRDDASMCFERHATSKITSEDNLFNITTLGFRGEALSSISAVSKVVLLTSPGASAQGIRLEVGVDRRKKITGAPPILGTTVEVRDIFYNTPARRKFLKSIPTELSHIIETVTQKAFAYPGVSFSLSHNNTEVLHVAAASNLDERFRQLYGSEFSGEFVEVKGEGEGTKLYGFCSSPDFTKATRSHQFIFINKRPVRNPTVSHAVYSAYREIIPGDRHPSFFLFLDIDPGKVDVNVHPAKREVRFESSEAIHRLILHNVRDSLNRPVGKKPEDKEADHPEMRGMKTTIDNPYRGSFVRETIETALRESGDSQTDFFDGKIAPSIHRYFYIGEAFVADVADNGLMIFDRHAVHERILYERLLNKIPLDVENLLLPIRVELPAKEFHVIMSNEEILRDFGFDIGEFGANNVILRALPRDFRRADIKSLLMDAASGILEQETLGIQGDSEKENVLRRVAAKLACHKSVRGRESLNDDEMDRLLQDLEKTELPDRCPHGRPTRIFLSLDDLRKMFKRK
jgi:DNA mismatch repair protein MutL